MMNNKPNKKYQIGHYIKVLSGEYPLFTRICDIKWDDRNNAWNYYFKDTDGSMCSEYEEAIEPDE